MKYNYVKNPLTIIGIFASIVEVSGKCVLPFLTESNQNCYMWFLIVFSAILLIIFFTILLRCPQKLYAPSDFKDENNFFRCLNKRTATADEILEKKCKEENHSKCDRGNGLMKKTNRYSASSFCAMQSRVNDQLQIEEAAIIFLEKKYHVTIERNVRLSDNYSDIIFDGVFCKDNQRFIVELRRAIGGVIMQYSIDKFLRRVCHFNCCTRNDTFLLVFICDDISNHPTYHCPADVPFEIKQEIIFTTDIMKANGK